jgi:hypothetical protein
MSTEHSHLLPVKSFKLSVSVLLWENISSAEKKYLACQSSRSVTASEQRVFPVLGYTPRCVSWLGGILLSRPCVRYRPTCSADTQSGLSWSRDDCATPSSTNLWPNIKIEIRNFKRWHHLYIYDFSDDGEVGSAYSTSVVLPNLFEVKYTAVLQSIINREAYPYASSEHVMSTWIKNKNIFCLVLAFRKLKLKIWLRWPPLWSSGQNSWLQIRRPGFDSRHYQKKKWLVWNGVHSASWVQLRSYLIEK